MKNLDLLNMLGCVWSASGATGFNHEGYTYDPFISTWVPRRGITDVAKTITALPRLQPDLGRGNMPLKKNYRPKEFLPKSIYITPHTWIYGSSLNAVGLSNPGMERAFEYFRWHENKGPVVLSFMPMAATKTERLEEVRAFVKIFRKYFTYDHKVAIQLNVSCPNTGHAISEMESEILEYLEILAALRVPIILKTNVLFPIALALEISKNRACAAISPSNTIPFGQVPHRIPWKKIFGAVTPEESPLAKRFPRIDGEVDKTKAGGYAGPFALQLVIDWMREFRDAGGTCHLNGGNGILSHQDVNRMMVFRLADSISIGSIKFQRPWNMKACVKEAYRISHIYN